MEVIHSISKLPTQKTLNILTIGTFDGVHIGHQKIIRNLVSKAKEEDLCALVLTFFPHPRMVLQKDTQLKMIDTLEEKRQLLESIGSRNTHSSTIYARIFKNDGHRIHQRHFGQWP